MDYCGSSITAKLYIYISDGTCKYGMECQERDFSVD
jgi:hypothetical protein